MLYSLTINALTRALPLPDNKRQHNELDRKSVAL